MSAPNLPEYFRLVDARLAAVSAGTAREMLAAEIERWTDRYAEFQRQCARGTYTGAATAWDFVETISGLDARLNRREAA